MRKFVLVLLSMMVAVAAHAQEALQCANPDALNSLVFSGRPELKLAIRRALPDNPAGYRAPAGFTLIGSGLRGTGTVVAYKTTLETGKAFDNLLAQFADDGWRREATASAQPLATVAGATPTEAMVCRNGERRNLRVRDAGAVRYAILSSFTVADRACDAPDPRSIDSVAARTAAMASMPQFSFPATARTAAGTGSRLLPNGLTSSSVRVESPDTGESLARHLARQLAEQGWRRDAEWNGALSSGSTWTRRGTNGQMYWGTLEVLSPGGNVYEVGFGMVAGAG